MIADLSFTPSEQKGHELYVFEVQAMIELYLHVNSKRVELSECHLTYCMGLCGCETWDFGHFGLVGGCDPYAPSLCRNRIITTGGCIHVLRVFNTA